MNKKILSLIIAIFCLSSVCAQNLLDNQYQKAGREYEQQAQEALNAGNYDDAAKYADLSSVEYRKSREYAETLRLKFRASNAITLAQRTITSISSHSLTAKTYADEIKKARDILSEARKLFDEENWEESRRKAEESLALLSEINLVQSETTKTTISANILPRYYVVVERSINTDCFWNISGMKAVYGDPLLWKNLWNTNRKNMVDPENPNLILPGMIIEIPSIDGEVREGTYDPKKNY